MRNPLSSYVVQNAKGLELSIKPFIRIKPMSPSLKKQKPYSKEKKALSKASKSQKIKLPTVSKAKKMAWKAFSEYIRQKNADEYGLVQCVTCAWRGPWQEAQAGHFIDGRNNSVLYHEGLVHPQCVRCNLFLNGNKVKYTVFMAHKYCLTLDQIDELQNLRSKSRPLKAVDHMEVYNKYTKLIQEGLGC